MATDDRRLKWISVEDYAHDAGMPPSELVSRILDGRLPGERQGNRWYVAAPNVVLVLPETAAYDTAVLKICACCLGSYVTAGRGQLVIALRADDPGRRIALTALNAAIARDTPPTLPLEVVFNEESFLFDSSLWLDLAAALVEYQALMDPSLVGVP
jgi:hypothetical protein